MLSEPIRTSHRQRQTVTKSTCARLRTFAKAEDYWIVSYAKLACLYLPKRGDVARRPTRLP